MISTLQGRRHKDALLQRVGNKCEDLLALIQQEHDPEISQPFICEAWASDEFQAFDLAKVGGRTEHVYV